jgi:hypothetical protein
VLLKGLVPPSVEAASGEIDIRRKLMIVQPVVCSGELPAL